MGARTIPAQLTGGTNQAAWTRTRAAALQALGVDLQTVISVVAHWARETRWGAREWRYNIGNIKDSPAWTGAAQVLPDGLVYRAYPDLASGVRDTLALLHAPRYAAAWSYLTTTGDGLGWYDRLMRAGWHPWSQDALDEYRQIRARVARLVGAPPTPAPPPRGSTPPSAAPLALLALASLAAWALWRHT